jgi:hypothetical protein
MYGRSVAAMVSIVLAGILAALPSVSDAADWHQISVMPDGGSVEIDRSSLAKGPGGTKKAWFRWIYGKSQRLPSAIPKSDPNVYYYSQGLTLELFNCAERTSATTQSIYRNGEGGHIGSYSLAPHEATWSEVAPETVGETMLNYVCKAGAT